MFGNKSKQTTEISVRHVIAGDGSFEGNLDVEGGIQIDGRVQGSVISRGDNGAILVGPTGYIVGPINAKTIIVAGSVKGDIKASHLTVKGTGVIEGAIHVSSVQMEMGARIKGETHCGPKEEKLEPGRLGKSPSNTTSSNNPSSNNPSSSLVSQSGSDEESTNSKSTHTPNHTQVGGDTATKGSAKGAKHRLEMDKNETLTEKSSNPNQTGTLALKATKSGGVTS